ncbi:MAG: YceI family protein [Sediminibacterium sp.]|nr:YceI family protein [Sediminibacterium sp.]
METTSWNLDPTHSEVGFKIKHLMISNVRGSFNVINASVQNSGNDFSNSNILFTAAVDSINTGNEQRDGHLKTGDFFNAEQFPEIRFESTAYDQNSGKLDGKLTIKGVSKPVSLTAEFNGLGKDPWGNEKAGFSVHGKINRTDFGLTYNAALETGGVLLGEDIQLSADVQFVKQK